jgi:uncharacterized membrane protein YkvA (DUF1232 family)
MKKRKPTARAAKPRKKKAASKPFLVAQARLAGDEITQSAAFRRAAIDEEAYVTDPTRLRQLVQDAVGKINTIPRGPFGETWPYLLAMIRVIPDYQRAEYRDMPAERLLVVIAAIIYFVSPFDVIPDWVPILGHVDDAFVVTLALKSVRGDLDAFMAWETARV